MSGEILVLAGTNGAGKTSVAGAALTKAGAMFYDPDRVARRYLAAGLSAEEATARAWHQGRRMLERAIRERLHFAFETTLGGRTITSLLLDAAARGIRIRVWYVGLASPELHIQRVRERVSRGGHDIPEPAIRTRWDGSRQNLIRLLPHLAELAVWDNSTPAAPHEGIAPEPVRILAMRNGEILYLCPLENLPVWAKPIVAAGLKSHRQDNPELKRGPAALRAFFQIAQAWHLGLEAQRAILGHPPRATYYRWRQGQTGGLRPDTLERLSHVVAIYELLHQLFDDPSQADTWLHQPNDAPGFAGAPAVERLASGRVADLVDVRRYLEGLVAAGA